MTTLSATVQTRSMDSTDKECGVPTLIEELKADQDPRTQCRLCTWISSRPEAERKEWAAVMTDRSFTHLPGRAAPWVQRRQGHHRDPPRERP
jgi:hypothetical protein